MQARNKEKAAVFCKSKAREKADRAQPYCALQCYISKATFP